MIHGELKMQSTAQNKSFEIPETMQAWVLGDPQELSLTEKPVPMPGPAEVLVRVDAVAICGTDLEILHHVKHSNRAVAST